VWQKDVMDRRLLRHRLKLCLLLKQYLERTELIFFSTVVLLLQEGAGLMLAFFGQMIRTSSI
jgi:hypothetical protein